MERRAATVWVKFVLHGLLPRLPVFFFIHTVCEWLMTMSRYWEALFVGRCVIRFCHCSLPVPLQRPEVQGVDMQLINSTRHKSHDISLAAWGNTPPRQRPSSLTNRYVEMPRRRKNSQHLHIYSLYQLWFWSKITFYSHEYPHKPSIPSTANKGSSLLSVRTPLAGKKPNFHLSESWMLITFSY